MKLFKDLNVGCKYTTSEGGAILMKIEEAVEDADGDRATERRNAVVVEGGSVLDGGPGTLITEDPMFEVVPLS